MTDHTAPFIDIFGYDSGWGCADHGCEDGPYRLPVDQILHTLAEEGCRAQWHGPMGLKFLGARDAETTKHTTLPIVVEGLKRLARHTHASALHGHIPLVIGGDHASAMGTWSGVVSAARMHRQFGLIWIDAHMDAHTDETSHEGKWGGWWHGQPVSALQGHGLEAFTSLCGREPKLSPQHITIIGAHSFEPAEESYVRQHGIRVIHLDEVKKRGFQAVFEEALRRATEGTQGFGMTIDLDAFHPEDSPGVGTTEADGLRSAAVLPIIRHIGRHPQFRGLEIAEFNPHNDQNHKTRRLIEKIIAAVFTKN